MLDNERTLGSIVTTDSQKRALANMSLERNVKDKNFSVLFPEYVEMYHAKVKKQQIAKAKMNKLPRKKNSGDALLEQDKWFKWGIVDLRSEKIGFSAILIALAVSLWMIFQYPSFG